MKQIVIVGVVAAIGSLGAGFGKEGFNAKTYVEHHSRLAHARELLGKQYKKSIVYQSESVESVEEFIYEKTAELLPSAHKKDAAALSKAILEEASEHEFDPIFLLSVIRAESNFNPRVVGSVGEIGLMQVRPQTAQWVAEKYKIDYRSADQLFDPAFNVKVGAAYFAALRERFPTYGKRYIAAYNMGVKKVKRFVRASIEPTQYPTRVLGKYEAFYSELAVSVKNRKKMWAMQ